MQSFSLNMVGPNSFAIKPQSISTTGLQFAFDYTQRVWASVKVNFWASYNPEIQVGFLEVGTSILIQLTFKLAAPAITVLSLTLTSTKLSLPTSIPSSGSSLTDSVLTDEVVLFRFQSLPLTSRLQNSPLRLLWERRL